MARWGDVAHDQDAPIAVVERCGVVHKACDFCIEVVRAIRDIVAYDEARVCFLGSEVAGYDECLVDWAHEPHDATFFQEHFAPQNLR